MNNNNNNNSNNNNNNKRPVLIRHRFSGVWIGYLVGPGTFENLVTIEGRRVWSWSGNRLECSQLAEVGVNSGDKLGNWETVEIAIGLGDGLVELRTIKSEVVEKAKELPKCSV